jgi:ABC-type transport system involved in cytochrome bd biosynthesis fused ATPase/permease subunit
LAVLCDAPAEGEALALTVAGRRQPLQGEVAVDGVPVGRTDVLVAVIAEGEELLPGSLEDNLGALCGEPVSRDTLNAIWEACSLDDVATALGDRGLTRDGSPLEPFHRLLLLAARVIPSRFRIVVVIDPMPWVNSVRRELWRGSLTRAAVGRTAVWVTADRDLAACADRVLELKRGGLRAVDG